MRALVRIDTLRSNSTWKPRKSMT